MLALLFACATAPDSGSDPDDSRGGADTADTGDTADSGDTGTAAFYDAAAVDTIERAVKADFRGSNATGMQVAVWHAGKIVYTWHSGTKDPDDAAALVDDDTLFQIGSDTKKMTAIAALQQVSAGTLSLDSTVAEVDPAVSLAASPDWAGTATLLELLSHQGGLVDYTPWNEDPDDGALARVAQGDFSADAWAMADPGACWNYANPNFSLAGRLTEVAGGAPWADLVEDGVFAPAGLTHTFARRDEAVATGDYAIGTGYTIDDDDVADPWNTPTATFGTVSIEDTVDNAFTRPAGMVWSTASDMAAWGGFFVAGNPDVLPDELRALTTEPQVRIYPAWDGQSYGMGWFLSSFISTYDGAFLTPFWSHGGNTLSMTSLTWVFPEKELSISILSNGYGDDFTKTALALVSGSGLFTDPQEVPAYPTEETDHALLTGTYVDHELGAFTITDVDGALTVDAPGLTAMGASYKPTLTFAGITDVYYVTVEGTDYDVTFIPDDAGDYHWLRNRAFVGERSDVMAAAPPHPDAARVWTTLRLAAAEPSRVRAPHGPR